MAYKVNLLQLSPTMTEGTIVKWLVKEGQDVKSGQPIAEIETDKAVMEQESFEDGKVLKIVVAEGARIPVESLIMVIGAAGEDISAALSGGAPAPAAPKAAAPAAKAAPAPAAPAKPAAPATPAAPAPAAPAPVAEVGRKSASPLARKIASDAGVDLNAVTGTGPSGRVIKRDVEAALSAPAPAAAPAKAAVAAAADAETITLSGMRKTIARRLVESKVTVPHFQLSLDVRAERLLEAVARIKESNPDAKVTITHFLIKAMASTVMRHKALRTQWAGDHLKVVDGAHISVAVAIEDGLVTPVIRNVQQKGLLTIASELRALADLARARKLTAEDMSGGVQTISNLGMFGIKTFNAIVNIPEASILAVGATQDVPVVEKGAVVPGKVINLTLSIDHRVVDGAVGAAYLSDLKKALEDPLMMLL